MFPATLALVDDDRDYTEFLSQHLRELGLRVDVFDDSNDLVVSPIAFAYEFYVVDLMLPGLDGMTLISLLRRRTSAGVLVVSGRLASDAFKDVISGGADMYLTKPVQFEQIELAIRAVHRRTRASTPAGHTWQLDLRARQLVAPSAERADLSETDFALMEFFVEARGDVVTRDKLRSRLAGVLGTSEAVDLTAMVYRLRRRVERSVSTPMPLQSKSKVGYIFTAPLEAMA